MLREKLSATGGDMIIARQRVEELEAEIREQCAANQRTTVALEAAGRPFVPSQTYLEA
jgi:hypothetical protein